MAKRMIDYINELVSYEQVANTNEMNELMNE